MVHLDGAPGAGGAVGATDFEGFTLDQLRDMVTMANPSSLAEYGAKLTGVSDKITRAAENLSACLGAIGDSWEGPSADRFGEWARQVVHATHGLGDYTSAAGSHIGHVGTQIFVTKLGIPKVDAATVAKANQGPVETISLAANRTPGTDPVKEHDAAKAHVEAARREAITQLRTLASTYRVATEDLRGLPAPVFPAPPDTLRLDGDSSITAPGGGSGNEGGVSPSGSSGSASSVSSRSTAPISGGSGGIQSAPQGYAPLPTSGPPTSSRALSVTPVPQPLPGSVHTSLPGVLNTPEQLTSSGTPAPSYVPQTTHLQGNGTLTGPGPIDTSWTPQVSGSPSSSTPPHTGSPSGGPPGMFAPPGIGNSRSPNGPTAWVGPTSGSGNSAPSRGGGYPGALPGGGSPSNPGRSGGPTPGTSGGQGQFTTRPTGQGGPGTTSPGATGTGTGARSPFMPGAPGGGGSPDGQNRGAPSRRLANSPGGIVGGAEGAASRRTTPTLRALPTQGGPQVGGSSCTTSAGQRAPFTGGTRSEQVRPRRTRSQDDEDNVWDGPRRPGVVPPVID